MHHPTHPLLKLIDENIVFDGKAGGSYLLNCDLVGALNFQLKLNWPTKESEDDIRKQQARDYVRRLLEQGLFSRGGFNTAVKAPRVSEPPSIDEMSLVVTERCNLRCKYCPHSMDGGTIKYRPHSHRQIDWRDAESSLDIFLKSASKNAILGFFGGEPLLNFPIIKKAIEKVNNERPELHIQFTLTSNLTALTPQIIEFLVNNKIALIISIDGSKEIHDKNRVSIAGRGSYEAAFRGLMLIHKKYPDYFKEYVSTNTVITPYHDLDELDAYFSHILPEMSLNRFSIANESNPSFYPSSKSKPNQLVRKVTDWGLAKMGKNNSINQIKESTFLVSLLEEIIPSLAVPSLAKGGKIPFKACIPGSKMMINCDGSMAVCDKCESLKIGDNNQGLDKPKINELMESFSNLRNKHCQYCWAAGFCKACYVTAWDGETLSEKQLSKHCGSFRKRMEKWLRSYLNRKRSSPVFFREFEAIG